MVFAILGPLLVFSPKLAAAKRAGLREYGTLAQRYVREFDHKWLRGGAPADEPLIGSADIQSLADLGNSFEVVKDMRLVPFTLRTVLQLAVVTLLPVAPLTADDDFAGGFARAAAEGRVLTRPSSPVRAKGGDVTMWTLSDDGGLRSRAEPLEVRCGRSSAAGCRRRAGPYTAFPKGQ